jgi:hypothetical protein
MYELRSICCVVLLREYLRKSIISGFFLLISAISMTRILRHATPARQCSCSLSRAYSLPVVSTDSGQPSMEGPLPMETGKINDELCTIGDSRGVPIRGLLGSWDAFGHWGALGLTLLAVQSATPTECVHVVVSSPTATQSWNTFLKGFKSRFNTRNYPKINQALPGDVCIPHSRHWRGALQEGRSAGMPSAPLPLFRRVGSRRGGNVSYKP